MNEFSGFKERNIQVKRVQGASGFDPILIIKKCQNTKHILIIFK
jgi:hypothetical protein